MTTALATEPKAPAGATDPENTASKDIVDTFYGTPVVTPEATPAAQSTSPAQPSPETAPTDKRSAPPAESEKKEEPPKEAEDEKHRAAAGRLGKEVGELKAQLGEVLKKNEELTARLNGTYKEPPEPTPEERAAVANYEGRVAASRPVANSLFGKDAMDAAVYGPDSTFRKIVEAEGGPAVSSSWREVIHADQPAITAMHIVKLREIKDTLGADPTQWRNKIAAELRPVILEELKKQLAQSSTGAEVPSVNDVRGTGGHAPPQKTIEELFYGKPKE